MEVLPLLGAVKVLFAVEVAEITVGSLDDAVCEAEVDFAAVLDGDALFPVSALRSDALAPGDDACEDLGELAVEGGVSG